jgi:type IV pilus assembly protein PilC
MPHYLYTAVDDHGNTVNGRLEANTQDQLVQRIRDKGLFLTSVTDQAEVHQQIKIGSAKKISIKSLAIFCRQFATLINAGITAVKSLGILYQQTEDKSLKTSLGVIYEGIQKGESLSEAFRKQGPIYPELFNNMLLAGESSGNLDAVLIRLADHFEKENKLNNKIKGAMIYPTVLSLLAVVVVTIMIVFVLPTFTGFITSGGGEIPGPTRFLIWLSEFLRAYWWLLICIGIIVVIVCRAFVRSEKGRLWWDSRKISMPIIGKSLKMIYTSRFARTLSTLLSSGIQMLPAIEITSRVVGNQLICNRLTNTIEDIRKGVSLSLAISKIEEFPTMIHNMIGVGEESGLLDDILVKTALFYDEESESAIQRLVGLLEPLLIIVMGLIIGFIVLSIFLPMLSMYETI